MEKARYVVGFDLNDLVSQISYFELNTNAPVTVSSDTDDKRLGIPTVLSKRKNVSQWYFGSEAQKVVKKGEGTLIGKLLSFARAGAKIELEGEVYDSLDLLILFVRRALDLIEVAVGPDDIGQLIFTVDTLEGRSIEVFNKLASQLSIPRDRIFFQTYDESIYYYTIHQPGELWKHDVCVFDYSNDCLKSHVLWMNRHTRPVVGFVDSVEYSEIKMPSVMLEGEDKEEKSKRLDEMILQRVQELFSGRTFSTVYLVGDGFSKEWCDKTVKFMCSGRRVFQGQNLYSKGACYCGADRMKPGSLNEEYIFLGHDKLKANTGLRIMDRGEEEYVVLVDAGETWYESSASIEFILESGDEVPVTVTPLDGSKARDEMIKLPGLPSRPDKATRLRLNAEFLSDSKMEVTVRDLGFGEFYPASGKEWKRVIDLI